MSKGLQNELTNFRHLIISCVKTIVDKSTEAGAISLEIKKQEGELCFIAMKFASSKL